MSKEISNEEAKAIVTDLATASTRTIIGIIGKTGV